MQLHKLVCNSSRQSNTGPRAYHSLPAPTALLKLHLPCSTTVHTVNLLSLNLSTSPELLLYITYIIFKLRDQHRIFAPLKFHNLKSSHQEVSSTVVGPLTALQRDPHSRDNSLKYMHTHSVCQLKYTHTHSVCPLCAHSRRHSETCHGTATYDTRLSLCPLKRQLCYARATQSHTRQSHVSSCLRCSKRTPPVCALVI